MESLTEQLSVLKNQEQILKVLLQKLHDQKNRLGLEELDLEDLIKYTILI